MQNPQVLALFYSIFDENTIFSSFFFSFLFGNKTSVPFMLEYRCYICSTNFLMGGYLPEKDEYFQEIQLCLEKWQQR